MPCLQLRLFSFLAHLPLSSPGIPCYHLSSPACVHSSLPSGSAPIGCCPSPAPTSLERGSHGPRRLREEERACHKEHNPLPTLLQRGQPSSAGSGTATAPGQAGATKPPPCSLGICAGPSAPPPAAHTPTLPAPALAQPPTPGFGPSLPPPGVLPPSQLPSAPIFSQSLTGDL